MNISSTFLLSIAIIVLIGISAFFSGTETSMTAINRYRLKTLIIKNNKKAKRVEKLLANMDHLFGVILFGNNLVNILAASITTVLAIKFWGEVSIIYSSIILTFVILIFAEITPKIFAAKNPEKVALSAAIIIEILVKILNPFVRVVSYIAKVILKMFGANNKDKTKKLSSEELRMVIDDVKSIMSHNYQKMLLNIIDLEKAKVENIMIHRHNIIVVDINDEKEMLKHLKTSKHTSLFVFSKQQDNIIGVLHMRDIAKLYAQKKFSIDTVKQIIETPYFVPEDTNLLRQLEHFQAQKKRLALVVDEYGEVKGMITMEDILLEITGQFNINNLAAQSEAQLQQDGSYLLNPKISIRELNALLKINLSVTKAKTLNGLILEELQDIPQRDISLRVDNVLLEIIKISEQTIQLVKLKKI